MFCSWAKPLLDSFLSKFTVASSFAFFSSFRFCSKWSIYNCLEVPNMEIISFVTGISNIDSYLRILSLTILIASIVSFFSEEPWFPTAVCLLRNRFQEHCYHGREIKPIWIDKQEKDISFCRHSMYNVFQDTEQIFQYPSFLPMRNFSPCFCWWYFFFIQVCIFWYASSGSLFDITSILILLCHRHFWL